ncbi:hypothetical protein ABIB90_004426 [Bradyrhizobium sp. JR4.1]|uniref:hypothetical protein n=1 Tax=unclassified Bradyrhizobium TaxID=2631580 RepID=UPI0033964650
MRHLDHLGVPHLDVQFLAAEDVGRRKLRIWLHALDLNGNLLLRPPDAAKCSSFM